MPTRAEIIDLKSGTYTTVLWTSGVGAGVTITPKAGDTDKQLLLPNTGYRLSSTGTAMYKGVAAYFWTSTADDGTKAYSLGFWSDYPAGGVSPENKLVAYSVRCVRTVE
jgi:hypothetical protein